MSDDEWSDDESLSSGPRETLSSQLPPMLGPVPTSMPLAPSVPPAQPVVSGPPVTQQPPTVVQTVLSLAVQLFPVLNNPAVNFVAGFSLFYDPGQCAWTFLGYDQGKRSVMLEDLRGPALTQTVVGKHGWATPPPLELQLEDGAFAVLTDHLARKWRVQFRNREDAHRLLGGLAAVTVLGQPSASLPTRLAVAELEKGSGHSLSSKYYARLSVRVQMLHHSWASSEAPALCVPPELESWDPLAGGLPDPTVTATGTTDDAGVVVVEDLKGCEDTEAAPGSDGLPRSLAAVLHRMKEGASRLLVLPAHSAPAKELLAVPGATERLRLVPAADRSWVPALCGPSRRSVVVALVRLEALSKKRSADKKDKDKEKKKKDKEKDKSKAKLLELPAGEQKAPAAASPASAADSDDDQPNGHNTQAAAALPVLPTNFPAMPGPPAVTATPSPAPAAPAAPAVPWPQSLVRAVEAQAQELRTQLQALQQCTAALPLTQRRILKALMSEMYDGLLDDLQLRATEEQPLGEAQQATVGHLQTRLRAVVEGYLQRNTEAAGTGPLPGSVAHLEGALAAMLGPAHHLGLADSAGQDKETAVLAPGALQRLVTRVSQHAVASAPPSGPSPAEQKELRELRAQVGRQGEDLLRMGEAMLAAEEATQQAKDQAKKLQQENQTLQATAATVPVFEQGLGEMRKLYESELAERQKLEGELRDLARFTAKMKLAWVPDKAQSHCLQCQSKFAMFGSRSKHHCRYCGRLFCKQCCTSMEIPEFGYQGKVMVCGRCFEFRQKVKAELGDDDAKASGTTRDDDD